MRTARIVQAVFLMMVVALVASCAASKEYTSKLFAPRNPAEKLKDSQAVALRFLDLDNVEPNKEDWVSTDIIMGRDTSARTTALDNFTKVFPAIPSVKPKTDSTAAKETEVEVKTAPVMVEAKTTDQPVAKSFNTGEVRTKKTRTEKK
jgi:hypothetical protein